MRRPWLLFLLCLLLLTLLTPLTRASLTVRVDDSAIRVLFDEQATRVLLPIETAARQTVEARIRIELVNTDGGTAVTVDHNYQLKPGKNELTIPIGSWMTVKSEDTRDLVWYRLRYQITPAGASQFDKISNIISLTEITPDIFSLDVAAPRKVHLGAPYRLRVSTAHPMTKKPIGGVTVDAEVDFDGYDRDDIVLKQSAVTDANGFATLDLQIPTAVEDEEAEITVTAHRGILKETAETEVDVDHETLIMVSSDKPLYQPGQTLHARILMFDSARHALANQTATVTVADPESSTTFREEITSTRFGVANVDWQIPENARLGDYRIEVKLTGDEYEDAYGGATVKISRYDLPNFTVNVKPDRSFYLSDQNAEVEVRADYLFGQPVKRGHVRVVRETERHWNYRAQKYETQEGEKYEGEADADGKFVAHIDLAAQHAELKEEDYSRYEDLTYAAYFTDPTTNRTEQRRFDLRITKEAIHLYVIPNGRQATDFPLDFYVTASYADGTPALCDVAISYVRGEDDARSEQALRSVKTNEYGIAKVGALSLPQASRDESSANLMFRARDSRGLSGKHAESFDLDEGTVVRITTDKSLYRDGESIHAEIVSNKPDLTVALDTATDGKIAHSQIVTLKGGRASVVIPFRRELSGTVMLVAYALATGEDDHRSIVYDTRTVLYPHDRDLKLNLALSQDSYRPGQDAIANFQTRSASGRAAESALGVVIFDKAVEERARTDREFGGEYAFYGAYRYLSNDFGNVAGVSRKDLDHVDWSKPLPDGLDLVAELLLTDYRFEPRFFGSSAYDSVATVFNGVIKDQIDPLKNALDAEYETDCDYPKNEEGLRRVARLSGISIDSLRDPWDVGYRIVFFPQRAADVLEMTSAGPDKQFGTDDDFNVLRVERPYFRFAGEAINRAVSRFHTQTGRYIRDAGSLKSELRQEGIDFDSLRDPWNQPYRLEFGVSQTKFQVVVQSSGPDRQFTSRNSDDVAIWTSSIDYARELQARIDEALTNYFQKTLQIPQSDADFNLALQQSGISREELRDPWGRGYHATFKQSAIYGDRVKIYSLANYGEKPTEKMETTPVTQQVNSIYLRSDGQDGAAGTWDDFNVATFTRLIAEQSGKESTPQSVKPGVILPGSTGAISGTVADPVGSVVSGAKVTARNLRTSLEYAAETGDDGTYIVKNLPAGSYRVSIDAPGFQTSVVTNVIVRSSNVTQLDVSLQVGAVAATVEITSMAETVNQTSTQFSMVSNRRVNNFTIDGANANVVTKSGTGPQPLVSTPRLREYFPETLVWQPSLETDKHGRARLNFKLADNITTWKMSVIGSTEDGQVGVVEKEIKAFQPFFVEHDPPRVLTEGDEISLPVVVRNYLNSLQTVNLDIKPESWFTLLGPTTKNVKVEAGDATRGIFDFRATASVKDGKQRITATGTDANDAIEKPVTVHPDGEEKSVTASDIISDQATLTLDVSATAIPNSTTAELKIYPNLLAHVTESVEAIMKRPYGCGEQTISSTYPSLLWLKNYKRIGPVAGSSALHAKAEKYLRDGYARLLNYRDESGGLTYWGRGEPDIALTAYALRFLTDARELIAVDDDVIKQARAWLIKQQRNDGSWPAHTYWGSTEDQRRTAMLTAYVARVLAMTEPKSAATPQPPTNITGLPDSVVALKRAFDYLGARTAEIDEPYLIASYALALIEANEQKAAERLIAKLRTLAHEQNGGSYWELETNTPFYGWGLAGRVETTALVVQALIRASQTNGASPTADDSINHGLLFLLREKDRYGVWYSTQATINVLDTLLAVLAREVNTAGAAIRTAEILVNGRSVKSVELPAANQLVSPLTIDLSSFVQLGTNRVEIRRARGSSPASAQAVATYYLPWSESVATQEANWRANGASGLRLVTKFDHTEGNVSGEINCHVEAERIGFGGYGMMLAEIGLPPGADVDRASLETAMKGSDWSISQYDVLPDRVVVYLWPRAGGTKFDFKFKPRFGLRAQSAASIVYDYYNPEARAIVAPVKFVVR